MKLCELKIDAMADLLKLLEALVHQGYRVDIAPTWKQFPERGVDYFAVAIFRDGEDGGADNG